MRYLKAGGRPLPATTAEALAVSSASHDPGAGLGEHETKAILNYKKKHSSMSPAQTAPSSSGSSDSGCR